MHPVSGTTSVRVDCTSGIGTKKSGARGPAHRLQGPRFVWEFALFQFAVHQLAIHGQFETAAIGWLQFKAGDFLFEGAEDFRRQTDGLRFVVSL